MSRSLIATTPPDTTQTCGSSQNEPEASAPRSNAARRSLRAPTLPALRALTETVSGGIAELAHWLIFEILPG